MQQCIEPTGKTLMVTARRRRRSWCAWCGSNGSARQCKRESAPCSDASSRQRPTGERIAVGTGHLHAARPTGPAGGQVTWVTVEAWHAQRGRRRTFCVPTACTRPSWISMKKYSGMRRNMSASYVSVVQTLARGEGTGSFRGPRPSVIDSAAGRELVEAEAGPAAWMNGERSTCVT